MKKIFRVLTYIGDKELTIEIDDGYEIIEKIENGITRYQKVDENDNAIIVEELVNATVYITYCGE